MATLLNSDKYFKAERILDMFKVTQLAIPNMTVHINSGTYINNKKIRNFDETNSDVLFAPKSGTWLVAISLNNENELVYTYGIQSSQSKIFPRLPEECMHLALIEIACDDTEITNDKIYDLRQLFGFAPPSESLCQCKCTMEGGMTSEQIELIENLQNQFDYLQQQINELKLLHEPQKVYRVKSDSGLLWDIRFRDEDGTPYFTRVGFEDNEVEIAQDYKFVYEHTHINIVNQTTQQYVQLAVRIKSENANNQSIPITLIISCPDTKIYSENYQPQYQENEFRVTNIELTKEGFSENFELNFHSAGNHKLNMYLYNSDTHDTIDSCEIIYNVDFQEDAITVERQ